MTAMVELPQVGVPPLQSVDSCLVDRLLIESLIELGGIAGKFPVDPLHLLVTLIVEIAEPHTGRAARSGVAAAVVRHGRVGGRNGKAGRDGCPDENHWETPPLLHAGSLRGPGDTIAAMSFRPVTFLTDFGYSDEYPGVCRLVIARVDPAIRVIDITHGIPPGDIRRGALALASAVRFSAPAVHLAVVDPGVGGSRRAIALTCGDHHLVGPDNGLLGPAAAVLGGVEAAFDISSTPVRVGDSDTFHGRDIFSPVAADLARGAAPGELGEAIGFRELVTLDLPEPTVTAQRVDAQVLYLDQYGNVILNLHAEVLDGTFLADDVAVSVETSRERILVPLGRTFGDVEPGDPVIYTDSTGFLALAVNRGSAASRFGLGPDNELRITPVASGG